jgi:hypothetical protein
MPINVGLPPGESCGSCYYSRTTSYGVFACCINPPNPALAFPRVDPDLTWCGQWTQTGPATSIVLQTTCVVTNHSTAATLGDTTGLISGKSYTITGPNIAANTTFAYSGAAAITLSIQASGNGTVNVNISDSMA